jgi:hypothetical protein
MLFFISGIDQSRVFTTVHKITDVRTDEQADRPEERRKSRVSQHAPSTEK